ncbi:MAG TPA: HYR domain-containing protein [Saprospiraceae bacterium]|nr:HYR domain-containing protein [Saprospiraceae bacterium]HMQ84559.1 HYR domain-containing protein [Saprospiraceae bacterium]
MMSENMYLKLFCSLCLLVPAVLFARGEAEHFTDYVPPVAICTDQVNVSLTSNGTALVYAASFDEGSYDNQCLAAIEVKKMSAPASAFGPYVIFDCYDIGAPVYVELRARDCSGNTNTCWALALVEDKIAPSIHCPYDVTITCEQNASNLSLTGQAWADDNCNLLSVTHTDWDNTGSCGSGYITRTWKATDYNGYMTTCVQHIYIVDNTPVYVEFPLDTTFHACISVADLDPDLLPDPYGYPIVLYEDCELMAFNYTDWVFTASAGSCVKILRQWKVLDWCSYNEFTGEGIWQETQILKIQDNEPPTFTCPNDVVVNTGYGDCVATVTLPSLTDVEDCLSDITIKIIGDLNNGFVHQNLPIGEYDVTYIVTDGCDNTSSCSITVSVVDQQAPGVVCIEGVSFPLMSNGEAALWASDVEQGSSFDFCTPYHQLKFRLGPEPAPGQTTPPADDFMVFDCNDLGLNIIALWAGDAAGNWSYCLTTAVVQDHQQVCGPQIASIAGAVEDYQGDRMAEVAIHIDSTQTGSYTEWTDSTGAYQFGGMPMGAEYVLRPAYDGDPLEGVSLADIILLAKHVMGVDTLDSPYQIIAADADASGFVDMEDVYYLHRLLLGIHTHFPDSVSWRFVPADFDFPDSNHPLATNFPEILKIDPLNSSISNQDFIAIKIGDLDGSSVTTVDNSAQSLEDRSWASLQVNIEDQHLSKGAIAEIFLTLPEGQALSGLHLPLQWENITLESYEQIGLDGALLVPAGDGITLSWLGTSDFASERVSNLLYLKLKAEKDLQLSEAIRLHTSAKAYRNTIKYDEMTVDLWFNPPGYSNSVVRNFPNPFEEETKFFLELDTDQTVRLTLWDTKGQIILKKEVRLNKGAQQISLLAAELAKPGIYLYQIDCNGRFHTGRLVHALN